MDGEQGKFAGGSSVVHGTVFTSAALPEQPESRAEENPESITHGGENRKSNVLKDFHFQKQKLHKTQF